MHQGCTQQSPGLHTECSRDGDGDGLRWDGVETARDWCPVSSVLTNRINAPSCPARLLKDAVEFRRIPCGDGTRPDATSKYDPFSSRPVSSPHDPVPSRRNMNYPLVLSHEDKDLPFPSRRAKYDLCSVLWCCVELCNQPFRVASNDYRSSLTCDPPIKNW